MLVLGLLLLSVPAGAFSITVNKTGANFIWYSWDTTNDYNCTKTVIFDNKVIVQNASTTMYIASKLNTNEQHILSVTLYNQSMNTNNGTYTSTAKTYEQDLWLPLYITLACVLIGWFTIPLLMYVGIISSFYGLIFAYLETNQSYLLFLHAFMLFFTMLACAFRSMKE
jgi:hypothetical protein